MQCWLGLDPESDRRSTSRSSVPLRPAAPEALGEPSTRRKIVVRELKFSWTTSSCRRWLVPVVPAISEGLRLSSSPSGAQPSEARNDVVPENFSLLTPLSTRVGEHRRLWRRGPPARAPGNRSLSGGPSPVGCTARVARSLRSLTATVIVYHGDAPRTAPTMGAHHSTAAVAQCNEAWWDIRVTYAARQPGSWFEVEGAVLL